MRKFTEEIERALDADLHYVALIGALTLPAIAAALEATSGMPNSDSYRSWCERWFLEEYPEIASHDLYMLRCGVDAHLPTGFIGQRPYERLLFTLPTVSGISVHCSILGGALVLDLKTFCRDLIQAFDAWYGEMGTDPVVQKNMPRIMQYRNKGMAPYITGVPLLA